MLASLAALLPLPKHTPFAPRPDVFIALAGGGFVIAVLGHLFGARTIVAVGIAIVFGVTVVVPIVLYLASR